jgi:hypothetical protein
MATRKTAARKKTSSKTARIKAGASVRKTKRWSAGVTAKSDALDLTPAVFKWKDPKRIARSLKRSAEVSHRRKAGPYQSAMSMLNFYINRGGRNLSASRKKILGRAKTELKALFHRE